MAGQKEGHGLVAHLHIAHASLFILRGQQHGDQIAAILCAGPSLGNDAVDGGIQPLAGLFGSLAGRQRQLLGQLAPGQQQPVDRVQRLGQRLADLGRLSLHVGIEQRLAHDGQGQAHHFLRHVHRRAISQRLPALSRLLGVAGHHLAVGGHALAVKRRLHQAALAQVQLALAGQQAIAQQPARHLQGAALDEAAMMRHQHILDQLRMVDQIEVQPPGLHMGRCRHRQPSRAGSPADPRRSAARTAWESVPWGQADSVACGFEHS
jgi:hypothetical protein